MTRSMIHHFMFGHHRQRQPVVRTRRSGQNLIEFVTAIPFVIVLIFCILEFGRGLHCYNATRLAASTGAFMAASARDMGTGTGAAAARASAAAKGSFSFGSAQVSSMDETRSYIATVNTTFTPIMCGISVPFIGGTIADVFPCSFQVQAIQSHYTSLY